MPAAISGATWPTFTALQIHHGAIAAPTASTRAVPR
jgi:hypothetical protein